MDGSYIPTTPYGKLVFFTTWLVIIGVIIYVIIRSVSNRSYLETNANTKRIQNDRAAVVAKQFLGGATRAGLESAVSSIPEEQRLLINENVLGIRLAGYTGPYNYGVFDEDTATRVAIQTGARCLILEIDHYEGQSDPVLLYRNGWGMKYSLNSGSIERVAKNIAGRAFQQGGDGAPAGVAQDPFFLILYFRNAPSPVKETKAYIQFLGNVAKQLQPLRNLLISQTPQGDFRRQANEGQLFFMPTSIFKNQIILMTNVDTSMFRTLENFGLAGQLGPNEDLDYLVHARLYSRESPSPFSMTSMPTGTMQPAAVITSPQYWLMTPPDHITEAVANSKKAWTLTMPPDADIDDIPADKVKDLFDVYGVHCFPISLADTPQKTDKLLATGAPFFTTAWNAKKGPLRFIPPKPIPILKPMPEMNAVGGVVPSPSL